jgi:phosphate starvation-inducible membrane PsiE
MLFDHTDTEMKNKNKKKIQISFLLFWELGHLILALFTNGHFPVAVLCPRRDKKKNEKNGN